MGEKPTQDFCSGLAMNIWVLFSALATSQISRGGAAPAAAERETLSNVQRIGPLPKPPLNKPAHSSAVRAWRCGHDNLGSTPGDDIRNMVWMIIQL